MNNKDQFWSAELDAIHTRMMTGNGEAPIRTGELEPRKINRRTFLKFTGVAASGLILGLGYSHSAASKNAFSKHNFFPLAFIRIALDGKITLFAKDPEIGQGIKTSLPMIIAEELDANWENVEIMQAPIDKQAYGRQSAGGSRSIRLNWRALRNVGAIARTMLLQAAATEWKTDISQCTTNGGIVTHTQSARQLTYGELAEAAAELPLPDKSLIKLKRREQFRLLGTRKTGVDNLALVTGKPLFGIDQKVPDMAYATYEKCQARGGRIVTANLKEIRNLPGVTHAFIMKGRNNPFGPLPGVAIVARSSWQAIAAKRKLRITWDESEAAKDSWSAAVKKAQKLAPMTGHNVVVERGNADKFLAEGNTVEGYYQYSFVAHAQMEPENCTAWYKDGAIELWVPTQTPQWGQQMVADLLGIDPSKVVVNQTRAGGGFGRRLFNDYMLEAAAISKQIAGPVQLLWTREDSMAHDYCRLGGFHQLKGAVDENGRLAAWQNHFITFTHDGNEPPRAGGLEENEFPHPLVKNLKISQSLLPWDTPSGLWRAPASNVLAFVMQSFIHELSVAANRDHVQFLLDIMGEPRWLEPGNPDALNTKRARDVITLVASKAGWGKPLPKGQGLGLAFHFSHAGHIAEVAHVSVTSDKVLRVHNVTVVADVGPIVNLSGAENQCEGSVVDGLSTMLGLEVTHEGGRVSQSNFHQYPILRMPHTPQIDVHFIQSNHPPTGLGEPALPPLAPAVCNAIFAATGERIRTLPISAAGYRM